MGVGGGGAYTVAKFIVVYMCHLVLRQQLFEINRVTFTLIVSYLHFFGQFCVKEIPLSCEKNALIL